MEKAATLRAVWRIVQCGCDLAWSRSAVCGIAEGDEKASFSRAGGWFNICKRII